MISDIVCEQLVKKKTDVSQMLKIAGVGAGGLVLSYVLYAVGRIADPATGMLGSMFFLCGIAGTVYFLRLILSVEYEYTFVNGELTIDRILGKSNRKNMKELDVKLFEKMGKYDADKVQALHPAAVLNYASDTQDPATMFTFFKDPDTGRNTVLLFTPNQKLIDALKPYVSATVYREAFREKQ